MAKQFICQEQPLIVLSATIKFLKPKHLHVSEGDPDLVTQSVRKLVVLAFWLLLLAYEFLTSAKQVVTLA